jgi:HSP20 family protein
MRHLVADDVEVHVFGPLCIFEQTSDPFRDVDRLFQRLSSVQQIGPRPMAMPMDAYRKDDSFLLQLDLPGVAREAIELTVEENVLTISAERAARPTSECVESVIAERTFGTFTRQVSWATLWTPSRSRRTTRAAC